MLSKQSGLYDSFKNDNSIESQSRAANIEELLNSVQSFVEDRQNQYREELLAEGSAEDVDAIQDSELPLVTLGDFLEDVSLLSAVDVSDDEDVSNKITMMTVHSSKGLEFPYVYVAGMEENIFPSGGMFSDPVQIEEERRLFYVALTRAKVAVNLSFAATRMRNGKHEQNSPSRFVKEIDRRYVDNPISDDEVVSVQDSGGFRGFGSRFNVGNSGGGRFRETAYNNRYGTSGAVVTEKRAAPVSPVTGRPLRPAAAPDRKPVSAAPRTPDADFSPVSVLELKVGQRIEHNRFGYGVIRQITGTGMDLKAKILFDSFGEKILLLKYAKIRVDKTIK